MSKQSDNSNNNNDIRENLTPDCSVKIIIYPGKELNITEDCKLESIEFLGLGEVKNYRDYNFQVETIRVGDKLIDASSNKEISWIKRSNDNLEIYAYDSKWDFYYSRKYTVEHCELISTAGAHNDQATENS